MHNPPHPGEFISSVYLEPNSLSGRELAITLGVATSTLSRILKGSSAVSPEMALRLSKALGRSPESCWPCNIITTCGVRKSTSMYRALAKFD
jgi:addiction module HigA family antidote